jgi:flagellar basal-body rod protein FlgG
VFQLDQNGLLVTSDGYQVAPGITIPPDSLKVTVARDGSVSVTQPNNAVPTQVGQLIGVRFPNNAGLRAVGQNLYEETQASGAAVNGIFSQLGFGRLSQGFLESSNVSHACGVRSKNRQSEMDC